MLEGWVFTEEESAIPLTTMAWDEDEEEEGDWEEEDLDWDEEEGDEDLDEDWDEEEEDEDWEEWDEEFEEEEDEDFFNRKKPGRTEWE